MDNSSSRSGFGERCILEKMAEMKFSSANDLGITPQPRQFPLRHLFALLTVCSVAAFVFTWFTHAAGSNEFLTAAQSGDVERLRILARSGMDVHYRDGWHTTALMLAASHGRIECVQFLIENGADPNERSRFNATPLMWAAESGKMEVVEFLIKKGAVGSLIDENGWTAADHARQNGFNDLANLIDTR